MVFEHTQKSGTKINLIWKGFMFLLFVQIPIVSYAQSSISELLKKHNTESVPYISVVDLAQQKEVIILDARELNEYNTSHLKGAFFVGYDNFNLQRVKEKINDRSTEIVVYCSLGIRSEDIAEQLKAAGYNNVSNLYGGIFEWCNMKLPVYNSKEQLTDSVHAFSKKWGKWLKQGIKVYE